MSNSEQHHHHHHHRDGATMFKQRQLAALERNKKIQKWLKFSLCVIAIVLFLVMVYVYMN